MNDSERGDSVEHEDAGERLDSWKEIAAYLGRGVTTVQRWEQHEGLPVHRLPHAKKGSIFALKSELDHWRRTRTTPSSSLTATPVRPRIRIALVAVLAL